MYYINKRVLRILNVFVDLNEFICSNSPSLNRDIF